MPFPLHPLPAPSYAKREALICNGEGNDDKRSRHLNNQSVRELPSAYVVANDFLRRLHRENCQRHRCQPLPTPYHSSSHVYAEAPCVLEAGFADDQDDALPSSDSATSSATSYVATNRLLRRLHAERQSSMATIPSADAGDSAVCCAQLPTKPALVGQPAEADEQVLRSGRSGLTRFCISDIVQCSHGVGGRCLQCVGRAVHDVPLAVYGEFCRVCPSQRVRPDGTAAACHELVFPALMSLAATLSIDRTERILHLGSGTGSILIAWSLLMPHNVFSGVEPRHDLHQVAATACAKLDADVQNRVWLHCSAPLETQQYWRQATVILVSPTGFSDVAFSEVAQGLQAVESGTRVVSFTKRLLETQGGTGPVGFELVREVAFRSVAGNLTAFIHRKLAA